MIILSIGTDRKLFEEDSAVLSRSREYASKVNEMHIIVFSLRKHKLDKIKNQNLTIYPTNSSSRLFYIFDAIKIGRKIVKSGGFSKNNAVLSCQDPFETGVVGYILHKRFYIPLQLQVHTDFLSPFFKKNFLNFIRVFIANFLVPQSQGLRVVSSTISDSIKNKFPNLKAKVDVLPIFVDIEKFETREGDFHTPSKSISVLMVSRFTKEKRIDIGLEAFRRVVDKAEDATMFIVGAGPEKGNIEKKIKDLNLEEKVKVLEWEKDVVQVYRRSDLFLLTSDYEGYGMTLIEAGASGLPIVTTNVGLAKTDLFKNGENSFVCPVGDADCLSKALFDLITDEQKRKLFKDRMRDNIKKVTIPKDQYVREYIALLEKLIQK